MAHFAFNRPQFPGRPNDARKKNRAASSFFGLARKTKKKLAVFCGSSPWFAAHHPNRNGGAKKKMEVGSELTHGENWPGVPELQIGGLRGALEGLGSRGFSEHPAGRLGQALTLRRVSRGFLWTNGCGSKNRYQNGTLVSGNMDQNLRTPSCLILSHTQIPRDWYMIRTKLKPVDQWTSGKQSIFQSDRIGQPRSLSANSDKDGQASAGQVADWAYTPRKDSHRMSHNQHHGNRNPQKPFLVDVGRRANI